jgi:uncharacterized SAM-binding protein YcdF (DUF218 family)
VPQKIHLISKWLAISAIFWSLLVLLPSLPNVRCILAVPLVVSEPQPRGDAAYILMSGTALRERISAAADLYLMGSVSQILLMNDSGTGSYNFVARANLTSTQWGLRCLEWYGVPRSKVLVIEQLDKGFFGTLSEARTLAKTLPTNIQRLVLVTSAPHTRRSLLSFKRVMPKGIAVVPYAATSFIMSAEVNDPLWLEYAKLLIYAIIARP